MGFSKIVFYTPWSTNICPQLFKNLIKQFRLYHGVIKKIKKDSACSATLSFLKAVIKKRKLQQPIKNHSSIYSSIKKHSKMFLR